MWNRDDFPVLSRQIAGKTVTYLDSAATSLRPRGVVDAMVAYETTIGGSVHRGGHALGDEASEVFERARADIGFRFGVPASDIVFVASTTAALNVVAMGLPVAAGANIVTDAQEHHAALLPWYGRCEVRMVDVAADGRIDEDRILAATDQRTAAVVVSQASNITGRRHVLPPLLAELRRRGIASIVDGAQGAAHGETNVDTLGCDYYAFSGHKCLGPTGVGVLTGRREALERLGQPIRGGGAVRRVTRTEAIARQLPHKLEPGTPAIAAVIGLGAAVRYMDGYRAEDTAAHERSLTEHMLTRARALSGFDVLGPQDAAERLPLVSLVSRNPRLDVDIIARQLSDRHAVMVRSGQLCCHPFFEGLGASGALRVSAHAYTSPGDLDVCFDALAEATSRY